MRRSAISTTPKYLFECQAEVFQYAVAVQEAGYVRIGDMFKFVFVFSGQEPLYDVSLGFREVGVLIEFVGLPVFDQGYLVVAILCEKEVQGVVFQAVHA